MTALLVAAGVGFGLLLVVALCRAGKTEDGRTCPLPDWDAAYIHGLSDVTL